MRVLDLDRVREVAAESGQIVEVLGSEEYDWAHLAGALHLPLRKIDERAAAELDPGRPVVVYCHDFL